MRERKRKRMICDLCEVCMLRGRRMISCFLGTKLNVERSRSGKMGHICED
jgi:hypothetical protein